MGTDSEAGIGAVDAEPGEALGREAGESVTVR